MAAVPITIMGDRRPMVAKSDVDRRQSEILDSLKGVLAKVEEVAIQGRENGNELKMLRRELGLDGAHGRIPQIESSVIKLEVRMDNMKLVLDQIEDDRHFQRGKVWTITAVIAFLASSGGVVLVEYVLHALKVIH